MRERERERERERKSDRETETDGEESLEKDDEEQDVQTRILKPLLSSELIKRKWKNSLPLYILRDKMILKMRNEAGIWLPNSL